MEVLPSPRGLIVDLITPLKKSGDIDGRGLGKQLDRVLPNVQALLLGSPQTGEGKNLGPSQRAELLEKAFVVVRGKVPILIWITHSTEEGTKENLQLLKERLKQRKYTGPVFWVDTPLYYHSNRGLPSHYKDLSTRVNERFLLHNDPELIRQIASTFKRTNIRTSILKELSQMGSIQGLIFLGSLDRARNYQKAVRARGDFRIYDGDESHFLTYPSLSGVVSVGANLAPKSWQKVTASTLNLSGERKDYPDSLQQIWNQGEYLRRLLEIYQNSSAYLIKQVLSDKGILESPTATEMEESTEEKVEDLKALMERYGDYP
jgi:dihydrodipicolinate synthase/N-acetylneuraminate lyase